MPLPFTFRSRSLAIFAVAVLTAVFPKLVGCASLAGLLEPIIMCILVGPVFAAFILLPYYYALHFERDRIRYWRFVSREMRYEEIREINVILVHKPQQVLMHLDLLAMERKLVIDITRFSKKGKFRFWGVLVRKADAVLNEAARRIAGSDFGILKKMNGWNWVYIGLGLLALVVQGPFQIYGG